MFQCSQSNVGDTHGRLEGESTNCKAEAKHTSTESTKLVRPQHVGAHLSGYPGFQRNRVQSGWVHDNAEAAIQRATKDYKYPSFLPKDGAEQLHRQFIGTAILHLQSLSPLDHFGLGSDHMGDTAQASQVGGCWESPHFI